MPAGGHTVAYYLCHTNTIFIERSVFVPINNFGHIDPIGIILILS